MDGAVITDQNRTVKKPKNAWTENLCCIVSVISSND